MQSVAIIVICLAAVVAIVLYKYLTLGERGAEYDLVIRRGPSSSLVDPENPHTPIELDLNPPPREEAASPKTPHP